MDRDSRNILFLLIGATLLKWLFSAPLYLLDDEAYYWVWSRNLSLSYFDHPPMIALLIRLSTLLFGESPWGLRALGGILAGTGIWLLLDIVYRIYDDKKILWQAAGIYLLAVPFFAVGTIMTPDTPLFLFLALGLWSFYRAVFESESKYWWLCGAALGAALLSKYTAVLWLASLFLVLLSDRGLRSQLRRPRPWLAAALALIIFSPVIYWNATHDWASFGFQLGHGFDADKPRGLFYLGEFFGGQAGLLTPGIFLLILIEWGTMTAHWKILSGREKFVLLTGLPPFLFFLYSATDSHVEANWPMMAYLTGIFLAARWQAGESRWRIWIRHLNFALLGLFFGLTLIQAHFKILPLQGKSDPTNRYYGWPEALDRIESIWQEYPDALPVGNKYQLQSQLAYRLGTAEIPALNIGDRTNHFAYFDDSVLHGRDILIVSQEKKPRPEKFTGHFKSVEHIDTIKSYRGADRVLRLQVYFGRDYLGRLPPPVD